MHPSRDVLYVVIFSIFTGVNCGLFLYFGTLSVVICGQFWIFQHTFRHYLQASFVRKSYIAPPGQVRPPASHLTNSLKINCTMYYTWVELGICTTGYSGRHKYGAFLKSRCFKSKYLLIQYVHDSDVWVFFSKRSWLSPSLNLEKIYPFFVC